MSAIRPFTAEDTEQVAEIHRLAHGVTEPPSQALTESYDSYLRHVFLDSPWQDERVTSLVYEQHDRLIGFIGIVPKTIRVGDTEMTAAVSTQLAVDPRGNVGLAGIALLKAFLNGPQDLSIADGATDLTQRLWTRFGGSVSPLQSVNWLKPLRPGRFAVTAILGHDRSSVTARILSPVASILDWAASSYQKSRGPTEEIGLRAEKMNVAELLAAIETVSFRKTLSPTYSVERLGWLLDLFARTDVDRQVDCVALYAERDALVGWYIGHLGRDRIYNVIKFSAADGHSLTLFDHLSAHAWRRDATAIAGRMQAELANVVPTSRGMMMRRFDWVLVHAKSPEILEPIYRGDTTLSRLDGEDCFGFGGWQPGVSGETRISGPA